MVAAGPSPAMGSPSPDENRIIGSLREIREECQDLQKSARRIDAAAQSGPDAAAAACLENAVLYAADKAQIEGHIAALRKVMELDPALHAQFGDVVTEIENSWRRVDAAWPAGDESPETLVARMAEIERELACIVYSCVLRTIHDRVRSNLAALRIGQALDFGRTFAEEIPDPNDRDRILDFLARHPKMIDGVVEPATGQIYRVASSPGRRLFSFVLYLILLALPAPGIWLYAALAPGLAGLSADAGQMLTLYFLLVIGSLAHWAVRVLKQIRSGAGSPVLALEDWVLWFHVKENSIVTGVLSLWAALVALIVASGKVDVGAGAAFFAGYSLDSFLDLFLQRFETTAAANVKLAQQKLLP